MKISALSLCTLLTTASAKTLKVHVVPHTHDDVGWLKTVDQYFYGANNTIQHANVQMILTTLIPALEANPERKFTYVEQAFFTRWYNQQTDDMKARVKKLVKSEQLAFVNGGWCMHDEAATHYMGMIDQTTLGHSFLKDEFDYAPMVGWQIDPFGHSSTQASLLSAEAGFDALYFGRIDYQDLSKRRDERRTEGIWRASPSLQQSSQLFWGLTGSFGGNYGPPSGFCWDQFCSDEPMMDDKELEDYNVDSRVSEFVDKLWDQASKAKGDSIMLTMGSDFQYENAFEWFRNMDSIIKNTNSYAKNGKIAADPSGDFDTLEVFYSNPNKYTLDRNKEQLTWEVKEDDFFPYSDCEMCFWTGYFTSRAELKRWERHGSSFLQAARQLESMDSTPDKTVNTQMESPLHLLDAAVGVVQHHDGVSGTAKQHVAFDYAKRIDVGFKKAAGYAGDVLKKLLTKPGSDAEFKICQGLNVSVCELTQEATSEDSPSSFFALAYNALSHTRSDVVAVPVSSDKLTYTVSTKDGVVASSVLPATSTSDVENPAPFTLFFQADDIPAMGAKAFKIDVEAGGNVSLSPEVPASLSKTARNLRGVNSDDETLTIENEMMSVKFDSNGKLTSINELKVDQTWGYYTSFDNDKRLGVTPVPQGGGSADWGVAGTCLPGFLDAEGDESRWLRDSDGQNSGAYIFRPSRADEKITDLPLSETTDVKIFQDELVSEVHAQYGDWVSQVTRVKKGSPYVEIEWVVGPVPDDDGIGREVVTKFSTDIESGDTFFTDSNGREFLERKLNYRPTWDMEVFQPVAGNYYPVNAAIFVEDDKSSLAVLPDRTQGGSSLESGNIEIMVQRRTKADDSRGVAEPLDETTGGVNPYPPYGDNARVGTGVIIKGTHRIYVGDGNSGAGIARSGMDEMFSPLNVFFSNAGAVDVEIDDHFQVSEFSAVGEIGASPLPDQIALITLQKVYGEEGVFFARLAHQYAVGEDDNLSQPAAVDLNSILPKGLKMAGFKEMTLTGNQEFSDRQKKKLKWVADDDETLEEAVSGRTFDNGDLVNFKPMEMRSFRIHTVHEDATKGAVQGWIN